MLLIRRPVQSDALALGEAWEDARRLYSDLDDRVFLPPDPSDKGLGDAVVQGLISAYALPDRWIRVADDGGETAGFITATLHEPTADHSRDIIRDSTRRHVKINTLAVRRSHWRRGVGRALVQSVEDWSRQTGASLLKVGTYAHGPAVAFYEAMGYGHRSVILEKYLD